MKKTPKMLEVEERIGEPIEDFLRREYEDNGKDIIAISNNTEISRDTISRWLNQFGIEKRSSRWSTYEEWEAEGLSRGYDQRNPKSLMDSSEFEDRSWYAIGNKNNRLEGWLNRFSFNRLQQKTPWQTYEEWEQHGIEQGYNEKNPSSLQESQEPEERRWYTRGNLKREERWLNRFSFNRERKSRREWNTFEEWKTFGVEQEYTEKSPTELRKSEDPKERSWYSRGAWMKKEKWLKKFKFKKRRKQKTPWQTYEEWEQHGIEQGYEDQNPNRFRRSTNSEERSWYGKGMRMNRSEKWLERFNFNRIMEISPWETYEEWEAEGIEKGYDQRSPTSLAKSEGRQERTWHTKGSVMNKSEHWLKKFPFKRQRKRYITTATQFQQFLQQDQTARSISSAAITLNGNGADMEELLVSLYEGRFRDADQVHGFLQDSREELYGMIKEGLTNLGYYVGEFSVGDKTLIPVLIDQVVDSIPTERLSGSLKEKFGIILRATYSPRFNESPDETLVELREKTEAQTNPKTRQLYEGLLGHYEKVKSLEEALG